MNQTLILIAIILLSILPFGCNPPRQNANLRSYEAYIGRYAEDLTGGEIELSANYQYMISQKGDQFIERLYFPETKTLIRYQEFSDRQLTTNEGAFREYFDEGQIQQEGQYRAGEKVGLWTTYYKSGEVRTTTYFVAGKEDGAYVSLHKNGNIQSKGQYKDGDKTGEWLSYFASGPLRAKSSYINGKLNGPKLRYDSTGQQLETVYYNLGKSVTQNGKLAEYDTELETLPSFPGCENVADKKAYRKCSDRRMLEFIYGNIRYPARARENGVEGMAIIKFVIEKDGSIAEVESVRGVSRDIRAEVIRIIEMMPKWHPGLVDGEPARVVFNLPVKFKLE